MGMGLAGAVLFSGVRPVEREPVEREAAGLSSGTKDERQRAWTRRERERETD